MSRNKYLNASNTPYFWKSNQKDPTTPPSLASNSFDGTDASVSAVAWLDVETSGCHDFFGRKDDKSKLP